MTTALGHISPERIPQSVEFHNESDSRYLLLVGDGDPRTELFGWVLYWHPEDGQWVALRL